MAPHPSAKALLCLLLVINIVLYSSSNRFSPRSDLGSSSVSTPSLFLSTFLSQPHASLQDGSRHTSPVLHSLNLSPRTLPPASVNDSSDASSSPSSSGSLSPDASSPPLTPRMFPFPGPPKAPTKSKKKWALVPPLLFYTVFLLAFLGICAGDFLVPNLATIADSLGLSDNTAGVTLLALGNGSPDVFSTYAAFRNSSGTLAIGELLGAASFIVSVVVGSMALVKPFKVHPGPFLRDVAFAIVAVGMVLCVLWDGQLTFLETALMVLLYVFYVVWVVGGTWWMARRREGKIRLEEEDGEENMLVEGGQQSPCLDEDADNISIFDAPLLPTSLPPSPIHRPVSPSQLSSMNSSTTSLLDPDPSAASSNPNLSLLTPGPRPKLQIRTSTHDSYRSSGAVTVGGALEDAGQSQSASRSHSFSRPAARRSRANSNASGDNIDVRRTTFSLLGAVEFRDVVNSLRKEGEDLSAFEGVPASPFASGHYHSHHPTHSRTNSAQHQHRHTASPIISSRRSFLGDQYSPAASSSQTHKKRKSISKLIMSSAADPTLSPRHSSSHTAPQSPPLDPIVISEPERSCSDPPRLPTDPSRYPSASICQSASAVTGLALKDEINPWSELLGKSSDRTLQPTSSPNGRSSPSSRPLEEPTPLLIPPPLRSNSGRTRSNSQVPSINLYEPPSEDVPSSSSSIADGTSPSNSSGSSATARPSTPKPLLSSDTARPLPHPSPSPVTLRSLFLPTPAHTKRRQLIHFLRLAYHTFFPSLQSFAHKSWIGRLLSVLAVPAILALTLTLCVVDNQADGLSGGECESLVEKEEAARRGVDGNGSGEEEEEEDMVGKVGNTLHARTITVGEDPTSRSKSSLPSYDSPHEYGGHLHPAHHPRQRYRDDEGEEGEEGEGEEEGYRLAEEMRREEEEEDTSHVLKFNKWLTALQCALGPLFVAGVLFSDSPDYLYPTLCLSLPGVLFAILVLVYSTDGKHPAWRLARCLLGFSVAMIWIMTIADEVVTVLTALGEIFGLSDAIIGLTIFAVGNSTADLVANLSIASFAPIMAFSACFGGPMLNILLGIGFSGAFVTLSTGKSYPLDFSPTLMASITGLLALLIVTIIFVPFNGFVISRKWGAFLIFFYTCSMVCNICAEIYLEE